MLLEFRLFYASSCTLSGKFSKIIISMFNNLSFSVFNLLQFLEEIDYSLAFKTLSERATFNSISVKSVVFSDAMDSYYNCIWDATLLEFIVNFLAKRGEHARKQLAVIYITFISFLFIIFLLEMK